MDLTDLSVSLGDIMHEESSGGRLFEILRRLVTEENWDGIADYFGDETVATIKKEVESHGRDELVELLGQIAKEKTDKLNREIKEALRDATSFQLRGSLGDKLIQLHKRADEDQRRYRLLAVAFNTPNVLIRCDGTHAFTQDLPGIAHGFKVGVTSNIDLYTGGQEVVVAEVSWWPAT